MSRLTLPLTLLLLVLVALQGLADPPAAAEGAGEAATAPAIESELVPSVREVNIQPVDDQTTWPPLISIFTRGGNWETDPAEAEAYATAVEEAHFGGLMESLDKLELCERHGLKLLLVGDWEEMVATAPDLVENPTILGYYIADHLPPENIPILAEWEDRFAAADPRHPALFTTEPRWDHYPPFIEEIQPRQVDFYYYQWHDGRDGGTPPHHFEQLEYYRDFARQLGDVRLSRWIMINSDPAKMRQSVSMSLAYDVRGFRWWVGWPMFDREACDDRGVPLRTEVGEEVASINQTIANFAPYFEHLTYVDTYHTAPQLLGTDPVPADHWYAAEGEEIAIGEYSSDIDDYRSEFAGRFLLVANRDIENDRSITFDFHKDVEASFYSPEADRLLLYETDPALGETLANITVTLEPGGCQLIRVLGAEDP